MTGTCIVQNKTRCDDCLSLINHGVPSSYIYKQKEGTVDTYKKRRLNEDKNIRECVSSTGIYQKREDTMPKE